MQEVKNDKKQTNREDNSIYSQRRSEISVMGQDDDLENEKSSGGGNQEKPKIYYVELMFIYPILIVADVADLFSWSGVGTVISLALDLISTGVTTAWLFWKGRRLEWNLIANLIEFIPIVDILPWRTTIFTILVIMDSRVGKKVLSKIEEVSKKTNIASTITNKGGEKVVDAPAKKIASKIV